jgi:predicted O-methyltransferase YrrM
VSDVPPLVRRAERLAGAAGFDASCRPEDGLLLHVLAARRGLTRVGGIGAGCGVGAAWIVSALSPQVPFVTVELDPARAAVARHVFADDEGVRVLEGDWRALLPPEAPFDLLFVDGADAKDDPETVVGLLTPGGTAILDDLSATWAGPDERRAAWLGHPSLAAVVVGTGGDAQALVATRVR